MLGICYFVVDGDFRRLHGGLSGGCVSCLSSAGVINSGSSATG
jgi:hypothetical protein